MRRPMGSAAARRLALTLGSAVGVWLILTVALLLGLLERPRLGSSDLLFGRILWQAQQAGVAQGGRQAGSPIVLVAIDDKTLTAWQQYGRLPSWPRSLHAQALAHILAGQPRTVAYDVLFDAPSRDDVQFAAALHTTALNGAPAADTLLAIEGIDPQAPKGGLLQFARGDVPTPVLANAAGGLAHVNVLPDDDNSVRQVPLFIDAGGQRYPSLSLLATLAYLRRPGDATAPISSNLAVMAGRRIPLDASGRMVVNFGSLAALPRYSYVDVAEGKVAPSAFRDKLVFIGGTAAALGDAYWTPASLVSQTPGVVIHAAAAATILSNRFLTPETTLATVVTMLLMAMASALLVARLQLAAVVLSSLGLAALAIAGGYRAFDLGTLPDVFSPLFTLAATTFGTLAARTYAEQHEQQQLKGLLGAYLSPSVMAQVTRDGSGMRLGGEKRNMTVLFSDVRGFTLASEHLDPTALADLLNEYFTAMGDVIFAYDGVIDKYVGDAIMAFWNAPLLQADHAALACKAALAMQQCLADLNRDWAARGLAPFSIGIGINTGDVAVGNMGSRTRFAYTVIGDAVNVASRLESLTKRLGASILLGAATAEALPASFALRDLDGQELPGRREPVHVYQLLAEQPAVVGETSVALPTVAAT